MARKVVGQSIDWSSWQMWGRCPECFLSHRLRVEHLHLHQSEEDGLHYGVFVCQNPACRKFVAIPDLMLHQAQVGTALSRVYPLSWEEFKERVKIAQLVSLYRVS